MFKLADAALVLSQKAEPEVNDEPAGRTTDEIVSRSSDGKKSETNGDSEIANERKVSLKDEASDGHRSTNGGDRSTSGGVVTSPKRMRRDLSILGEMMSEMGGSGGMNRPPKRKGHDLQKAAAAGVEPKQLFVQLNELDRDDSGDEQSLGLGKGASWKSRARWIKFEENWEEGASRWSKPHVASLTFNSLPLLRRSLENGFVVLDMKENRLQSIFKRIVDGFIKMELLEPEHQDAMLRMLRLCGTGYKKPQEQWKKGLSAVRSLSLMADLQQQQNSTDGSAPPISPGGLLALKAFTAKDGENKSESSAPRLSQSGMLALSAFTKDQQNSTESSAPPLSTGGKLALSALTEDGENKSENSAPRLSQSGMLALSAFTKDNSNSSNNNSADEVHVSMVDNHGHEFSQNNNNSKEQKEQLLHSSAHAHREGIMRKLPEDAEGAMVMVAKEDSLKGPVAALIRLVDPPAYDNFLEAPIPLRFIFFLAGPDHCSMDYHEVGRAMSTLFSNDIFRDMAYAALDKQELLSGINAFLNDTVVLPPGDWDEDLLLPLIRQKKREQEAVTQRQKTEKESEDKDALDYADPLQRTGRIFGGLINDVKRRFRHYRSDFTDAFNFQCVAAFIFVYFACLSPAITFGGLLGKKTDNWMGASEMIVSTSLCGMLFALFAGQPLVMLGGTGPVLIFEEYLYKFCKDIDIDFMAFRTWIGFWIFILAVLVVASEGSVQVRYFTRFTEEIFSTLISIIFMYETYKGLKYIVCANPLLPNYCIDEEYTVTSLINVTEWTTESTLSYAGGDGNYGGYPSQKENPYSDESHYNCNETKYEYKSKDYGCSAGDNPQPNTALFAIILTFGTFFISFFLRIFRSSQFLGRTARRALSNLGIAIAILIMVALAYFLSDIYVDTIKITDGLHPTDPCKRGWLINPMGQKKRLPLGAIFGAIVPAFMVFILLYMETLLIGMVVNKECNKLKKGSGYHLDLFLIGVLSALAGVIGVPWMCAAPIRTVSHIGSLTVLTRTQAPGVKPKLDHIKDQRVTNFAVSFLIGLSNLMAPFLQEIPIAVLFGVFLYLGVTSLSGLQFIDRLKILFMPPKYHPDVGYIRMVKVWKMHAFTLIQVVCMAMLWVIKSSIIAVAFPFFLILLVIIRKLLAYIFSETELEALDSEEDEDDHHEAYDNDL